MQTTETAYSSKIRMIKLENFMSIGLAEIPMGAITSLCGYNDQGKSAVRTAFEILFYDSYSNDQVKYIKDGEEFFRITLTFDDGISISKEKRLQGQSVWSMCKGKKTLYTNMNANGAVTATEDVPEPIALYLGVYYDEVTGQELNVRKDRDAYFLVDTSGGDNFKLLNPLLHSETLSKASELMLKDSNVCKVKVDETAAKKQVYEEMLSQKPDIPEECTAELDRLINETGNKVKQQELIESINSTVKEIDSMVIPPEVTLVDNSRLQLLMEIQKACANKEDVVYDEITLIDTTRIEAIKALKESWDLLQQGNTDGVYDKINTIDNSRLNAIKALYDLHEQLQDTENEIQQIDVRIGQSKRVVEENSAELERMGYKICKNCGSLVN